MRKIGLVVGAHPRNGGRYGGGYDLAISARRGLRQPGLLTNRGDTSRYGVLWRSMRAPPVLPDNDHAPFRVEQQCRLRPQVREVSPQRTM